MQQQLGGNLSSAWAPVYAQPCHGEPGFLFHTWDLLLEYRRE